MENLSRLRRLRHLYRLKSLGFRYTENTIEPVEEEETGELPDDLDTLRNLVVNCHLCPLAKTRKHVVFGEGSPHAALMVVGEGPGATEDETGRPFVGRAGQLLTQMLEKGVGVPRPDVFIANVVKCRPPGNRVPTREEVESCRPFLQKQIQLVQPRVILALGATSYRHLTGDETSISRVRGKAIRYGDAILIPSFHPSFLLRNPSAKREAYADMLLVKAKLQENG